VKLLGGCTNKETNQEKNVSTGPVVPQNKDEELLCVCVSQVQRTIDERWRKKKYEGEREADSRNFE
jgi:hypothetical protein